MEGDNNKEQSSMQTDEDNWRDRKTLAGCAEQYLLNGLMSDVTFRFKSDGGRKQLKAHRLILSMRSAVYEKMFFGLMADNKNEIEVKDIDGETFELLLRFIYTDQVDLNGDTVLKCLYAARKYCLGGLVKLCSDFLENSIAPENVCTIYEQAKFYRNEDLKVRCKKFITENAESVFMSKDIQKLSYDSLLDLISDDKLQSDEIIQFEMALSWADGKCKVGDIEPSVENKRKVLGEIIEKIRYPVIVPETFVKKVVPTKLLLPDDQMELLQFMVTMRTDTPGHVGKFISYPRQNTLTINLKGVGSQSIEQIYSEEFSLISNFNIALLECSAVSAPFTSCSVICNEDSRQNQRQSLDFDFFEYTENGGHVKPGKGRIIKLVANKHYKFVFNHDRRRTGIPVNEMRTMNHVVNFGELSVTIEEMPLNINTIKFCRV